MHPARELLRRRRPPYAEGRRLARRRRRRVPHQDLAMDLSRSPLQGLASVQRRGPRDARPLELGQQMTADNATDTQSGVVSLTAPPAAGGCAGAGLDLASGPA